MTKWYCSQYNKQRREIDIFAYDPSSEKAFQRQKKKIHLKVILCAHIEFLFNSFYFTVFQLLVVLLSIINHNNEKLFVYLVSRRMKPREFSGGQVLGLCSHCGGPGFNSWLGADPTNYNAAWPQKREEKNAFKNYILSFSEDSVHPLVA